MHMKHIKFHFDAFPGGCFAFVQELEYLSLIRTVKGFLTYVTCLLNLSDTAYLTILIFVFKLGSTCY